MIEKFLNKAAGSLQPALYVVATPIGNLADITLRALAVLGRADLVCAEDTRVTAQLLAAYGIQAKLMSVREHNEQQMADKVVAALSDGLIVAQVSDAGTPAVCDPGARLAARVRGAGFNVVPVVGASAVMAALSGAGVSDMAAVFPQRRLTLARELTKTFETFLCGTVSDIQTALADDGNQARGEMVLILHPAVREKNAGLSEESLRVMKILSAQLPTKQAAVLAAEICGENKKSLYDAALAWK